MHSKTNTIVMTKKQIVLTKEGGKNITTSMLNDNDDDKSNELELYYWVSSCKSFVCFQVPSFCPTKETKKF